MKLERIVDQAVDMKLERIVVQAVDRKLERTAEVDRKLDAE